MLCNTQHGGDLLAKEGKMLSNKQ